MKKPTDLRFGDDVGCRGSTPVPPLYNEALFPAVRGGTPTPSPEFPGFSASAQGRSSELLLRGPFSLEPPSLGRSGVPTLPLIAHPYYSCILYLWGHSCQQVPVLPNPPAPRSDSLSWSLSSHTTRETGAITIWAIRSPQRIWKGSHPRFTRSTRISPR